MKARNAAVFVTAANPGGKPKAKTGSERLLDSLPSILATLTTAISAVVGYFFITVHDQQLSLSKFNLDVLGKQAEIAHRRDVLSLDTQKAELERTREGLKSAELAVAYMPKLWGEDRDEVQKAAVALAVSGRANVDLLVAAVGNDKVQHTEQLTQGLRIMAVRDHVDVCNLLCAHAKLYRATDNDIEVARYASALGAVGCSAAGELVDDWAKSISNKRIPAAATALKRAAPSVSKNAYASCKVGV